MKKPELALRELARDVATTSIKVARQLESGLTMFLYGLAMPCRGDSEPDTVAERYMEEARRRWAEECGGDQDGEAWHYCPTLRSVLASSPGDMTLRNEARWDWWVDNAYDKVGHRMTLIHADRWARLMETDGAGRDS